MFFQQKKLAQIDKPIGKYFGSKVIHFFIKKINIFQQLWTLVVASNI
jgi:hypothetical protein